MSSTSEERAALVIAPTAMVEATGPYGVYRIATSGSAQNAALPEALVGKWIDLYCSTNAVQFAFGEGSAPTLVYDQASAVGTGHVAAGKTLPVGVVLPQRVPDKATHLSWIGAGAGGFLEFHLSERPG